jgi:biopolymer transport protein ExbD
MPRPPSNEEMLAGLQNIGLRRKKRIHERHKLAIGTSTVKADINVTPLVDVVLVLLIIFMVITPMITRGRPVEMPETDYHDKKSDSGEQLVVSVACEEPSLGVDRVVCNKYSVWVGTDRVEGDGIIDKIQQEMRKSAGREVHIKADKRLNYGPVREVMQKINQAGVPAVALGSEEAKERK